MKFISWNVNGFRACLEKGFAEFFAEQNADFVCLQETKMQVGQATFEPEGYYQYWNSAIKKGYSGTAIFTKHKPLSVRYGLGIEEHDTEGRAITLEYEDFYLLCVYTPNAQRELTRLDYNGMITLESPVEAETDEDADKLRETFRYLTRVF